MLRLWKRMVRAVWGSLWGRREEGELLTGTRRETPMWCGGYPSRVGQAA